jgi:hypothetical protein
VLHIPFYLILLEIEMQFSTIHSVFFATVEMETSWDMIKASDLWEDDDDNGYVLVKPEDAADGIAFFVATYLLTLTKTKVGMSYYFPLLSVILSITLAP